MAEERTDTHLKCKDCTEYKRCKDSFASWIFFLVGLVATIAIRAVTILVNVKPFYGKLAWYIGVGGFLIFFIYKFRVSTMRANLIEKNKLMDKMSKRTHLTSQDYALVGSILCALKSRKETINYLFIFGLSAVALVLAIYLDFIR